MIPTRPLSASLPRLLSLLPKDGQGASIFPTRWAGKGLPTPANKAAGDETCRWEVKRVKLAFNEGAKVSGKAWGVLYWKGQSRVSFPLVTSRGDDCDAPELTVITGKRITPAEKEYEKIRGGLKYEWSTAVMPPILANQGRGKAAKE